MGLGFLRVVISGGAGFNLTSPLLISRITNPISIKLYTQLLNNLFKVFKVNIEVYRKNKRFKKQFLLKKLNPLISCGNKSSYILAQTYTF